MSQIKRLRCFVVGCNNKCSSRHLLPTSEPLKTQRIKFVFEGNVAPDLPKCVCSRESFVIQLHLQKEYKVFFMNLCKSPFLIMC